MAESTRTLFVLDAVDAGRVEYLLVERAAIEAQLAMIFKRALKTNDHFEVVFGPPKTAEFIIGGHTVGSPYIVTPNGCGVYDIGDMTCEEIPCDQVPTAGVTILPH